MLLNRNIKIPNKNAFYHLIIGLIFLGMAFWVVSEGNKKESGVDQFDWIYIAVFGMVGLYFCYKGLNYILRKAYIRVDDEKISVKPDESTNSETIFWRDIKMINEIESNYQIVKKDDSTYTIYFSYYTYKNADDLKQSVKETANAKGIKIEQKLNLPT
ncbi:MAG: hypothetical protein GX102_15235 [Porphyromonadaceae bacterium]|jgi:hypothetical protein|nr:hypothetical protein [Porphyromonadaceae bacterium]